MKRGYLKSPLKNTSKYKGEKIMFKSFAWNLNRVEEVIIDSLVSCAPITGKFYGRDKRVIPI